MEWKWMKGDPCERSLRRQQINDVKKNVTFDDEPQFRDLELFINSSSINYNDSSSSMDAPTQDNYNNGFKVSNKREELDNKIANRYLVQQIGRNPFLSNTNYLEDINIRDKFLIPRNTTTEKEQNSEA